MSKDKEKETILTAAQDVFARKGSLATSLEDIAKEAKLDSKKLKAQYPSVEALLDEIIDRDVTESSELFTKIINDRGKADIKLTRLVRELLTKYQKSYPLFQVISMGVDNNAADDQVLRGRLKQEHLDRYRQNTAIIGRLIAQGQSENLFTDVDPLEAAYLLRGMISAAIRYRKVTQKEDDMRDHADIIMRVFLKGLLR
ncbi:MAG: TetR/AcrR family transcriptional regulator [Candidatus Sumerlaeaceae bacterium]